jgi:hypothetical protein
MIDPLILERVRDPKITRVRILIGWGGGRSLVSRKVTTSGLLLFYLCCKKWSFVVLQSFLGRLSYRKTTKQEDPKKIMKKRQMEWVEMLSSE